MKSLFRSLLLILIVYAVNSCFPKKLEPLSINTTDPAKISSVDVVTFYATIATLKFSIVNPGAVAEYGYVYSTSNSEPTRENSPDFIKKGNTPSSSEVVASVFSLKPNTTYFIAPYLKDFEGFKYGKAISVKTKPQFEILINPGSTRTGPPQTAKGLIYIFSTAFMLNDDIYVLTSDSEGYKYATLQQFNLSNKQWKTVSFPGMGLKDRTDAVSFVINNKAYVGLGSGNAGNATDIYAYQPDRWESVKSPSTFQGVPELKSLGGIGYTFNGRGYVWNGTWTKTTTTGILFNDGTYGGSGTDHIPFWEFDPGTGAWGLKKISPVEPFIPTMRQSPFYYVMNDRLYFGGGLNRHPSARQSDIYEMNLTTNKVRVVVQLPGNFIYTDPNLSNGNHRNLAAGLQGEDWKRGYVLDVKGNFFMMDVTNPDNVSLTPMNSNYAGQGIIISNGKRLFFMQAGQNYQVLEIFP